MADYQLLKQVQDTWKGIPVSLRLQQRLDHPDGEHYVVCWRTRYRSGSNRRFYYAEKEGGCWTLPVSFARDLMEHAEFSGMFDGRYDFGEFYLQEKLILSRNVKPSVADQIFGEITGFPREPEWGRTPSFVAADYRTPRGITRKIMVVDSAREFCTFRTTTTDPNYKPIIAKDDGVWRLDNSMQDADTAVMRVFLEVLKAL